ncbi:enoyl-CoA hydratase [Chryseobacterium sp. PTM-20240506]|uniref:enoyl-CoA hydratase n=1 Tax=unclassified Chryseobacterium TaxID=2593645 RepID=UPI00235A3A57|nr:MULTISPECIES: enoyl-CoA hydratase [unclassified Chryseobacterium]MDC8102991.1 enoyl-CoA hydratase [Chryseobacterium sp. B21-037]MDQ1802539.1 enoyl-CoA hydratase [Chryseobacterium sp. CKR4-1]
MLVSEKIFSLIKKERQMLGDFENYKIKISNSDNFDRENLIGIYKIRQYTATRNGNVRLSQELSSLLLSLENYSESKLRFVSITGEKYYGMFYLSENWHEVIGYFESELDENGNIIN